MKRAFTIFAIPTALLLALGPVGCSDDDDNDIVNPPAIDEFELATSLGDTYFTSYTTPSGAPVNIAAADVYANLIDGNAANDPYILDWRSAAHFALGHIEGAHNVALANFETVLATIPAGKMVLNVCYTGQSASHPTAYMNMLGIPAQNLKFGMCGWTSDTNINLGRWDSAVSDEYADWLTTVTATPTEVHDFPVLDTGKTTATEILKAAASDNLATNGFRTMAVADLYAEIEVNGNADDYFVVNYFANGPYNAGHIPGAYQFAPNQSLGRAQMLKYLPTDKTIVVYCYTGQTSSQVVAYLNALGYDAVSLLYGVNAICHTNDSICVPANRYHVADNDYPVVQ